MMRQTRIDQTILAKSEAGRTRVRLPYPRSVTVRHCLLVALPLALFLAFLFPVTTSAHALQLRSTDLPAAPGGMPLFPLTMMAVIELGAVCWVGIHLWQHLSLYPTPRRQEEKRAKNHHDRFELRIARPILLILLLAHLALLITKSLTLSDGNVALFWLARVCILLLALHLSLSQRQFQRISLRMSSWINLLLGLVLFVTLAFSHTTATARLTIIPAVLGEFLFLLAAALWIGGTLSIATCTLPISSVRSGAARVHFQIILSSSSFPWIVAGGVIMALAGWFAATTHVGGWEQLRTTLYGQVFLIGGVLVGTLLLAIAMHLFLLQHDVRRAYAKYAHTVGRNPTSHQLVTMLAYMVKQREARLALQVHQLRMIVGLEAVVGVGAIICFGLLTVFASSLLPPPSASPHSQATGPFQSTMKTFDTKLEVTLTITPNRFGSNVFSVKVVDTQTGVPITNATATLITKMGEMEMGTLVLQSNGHGVFSTHADMAMSGDWQIILQIITPDNVLHEAYVTLFTPL